MTSHALRLAPAVLAALAASLCLACDHGPDACSRQAFEVHAQPVPELGVRPAPELAQSDAYEDFLQALRNGWRLAAELRAVEPHRLILAGDLLRPNDIGGCLHGSLAEGAERCTVTAEQRAMLPYDPGAVPLEYIWIGPDLDERLAVGDSVELVSTELGSMVSIPARGAALRAVHVVRMPIYGAASDPYAERTLLGWTVRATAECDGNLGDVLRIRARFGEEPEALLAPGDTVIGPGDDPVTLTVVAASFLDAVRDGGGFAHADGTLVATAIGPPGDDE
jgi:hypothetical protein